MLDYRNSNGFSLIELVIALVIVGIIASFAFPSFSESMHAGRRADAITSLMQIQLLQEKWRANHTSYTSTLGGANCNTLTATGLCWSGSDSLEGYYTVSVLSSDSSTYSIKAVPKSGAAQEGDRCGSFFINQDGPDYSASGAANSDCWKR